MEKTYLLALTFFEKSSQVKKVSNYRSRFDYKFENLKEAIIPLLPPFQSTQNNFYSLAEDLKDICDGHFFGEELSSLKFNAIDLYMSKDNVLLYLRPQLSTNLKHAQDHLYSEVKESMDRSKSFKMPNSFLTIGRFKDHVSLNNALEQAKAEFKLPFNLSIKAISLFEKNSKGWGYVCDILAFADNSDIFLQSEYSSV